MSFPAFVPPAAPAVASAAPAATAVEEPLLPRAVDDNELRAAVGASPIVEPEAKGRKAKRAKRREDEIDDDNAAPRRPRNRKLVAVVVGGISGAVVIGVLVFLGSMNSDRYVLACEAERAVPQRGRGFPPWGTRALDGEAWKPLKIAAETRCKPYETEDARELERLYLGMIMEQATGLLTAREVTKIDDAEALLKQGLLLTRPPAHESEKLATERNERHKDIERLLGDVAYWRATAKLRDAAAALGEAAKQFDSAAAQHPRHVSDAPAWATYARKLADELRAGPAGAPAAAPTAAATTPERAPAPPGVALPVEPGTGSAAAAPTAPSAPAAPPDAGVSPGGVLL